MEDFSLEYKPEAVEPSQTELDALAMALVQEINACTDAKSIIEPVWQRVEDVYRCDPKASSLNLVDGMAPYSLPLYRQKANAIARGIVASYFTISPWAQLMAVDGVNDVEGVEQSLQALLEGSNLKQTAYPAALNMVHFNCGVIRAALTDDGKPVFDNIHPSHTLMYPVQVSDYSRLKSMGHRFFPMRWQIEADVEEGEYRKVDVAKLGHTAKPTGTRDTRAVVDAPQVSEDETIEVWDIITKIKLGKDKERQLYRVLFEKESRQFLKIEKYPYSRPWYFVFRADTIEQTMYPADSIGRVMQQLNLAFNDVHTTLIHGSYMSAFPLVVITGGQLSQKVAKFQPGQIVESAEDLKVQSISTGFDPKALPIEAQKIEELADAVSGISRLGTSQNLPASTSATAASGFLAAQDESKDQYVESVEGTYRDMFTFILECMKKHVNQVATYLGEKWDADELLAMEVSGIDVQPTGGGATTDPRLLGQKLATLQELAKEPYSELDPVKVQQKTIETLDLPFSTESLKKDKQVLDAMEQQGGMNDPGTMANLLQVAGMGGDQGAPIEAGGQPYFEPANPLPITG